MLKLKFKFGKKPLFAFSFLGLLSLILLNPVSLAFSATAPSPIVVDDVDAVFVGSWGSSDYISGFYGDAYRYRWDGDGSDTATWSFSIPEGGTWEVFAIWSSYPNRANDAPYTINHADGSTTVHVNQEINGGEWVSLGVYNFDVGSASIVLSNNANSVVIADAVTITPINTSPEEPPTTPVYVSVEYSSNPISVNALIDGTTIADGTTIQVTLDSSLKISATNPENYLFSHWSINEIIYTQNPLTIDAASDLNIVAEYSYQQPPPPPPSPSSTMKVGVNIWGLTSSSHFRVRDVPLLKEAGIEYLRVGVGIRGSFVDAAVAEGIDVIGTFGTNGLPDLNAFGDYVYNRVLSFKGRISAWVVFNEANYFAFNRDPQGYTQALKVAYTRAKQADPNVLIVTSNFLSTEGTLSFLEDMYQAGAKGYFDALGIDPYCYPESPTYPEQDRWGHTFWRLPQLHDLMVQNGDGNKPIWIIEFGYRTPSSRYPLSHSTVVSETEQANLIADALELAQTWPWLERFYIYEWMDSADVNLGYWGLIREDYLSPYEIKPAYYAVKNFVNSQN